MWEDHPPHNSHSHIPPRYPIPQSHFHNHQSHPPLPYRGPPPFVAGSNGYSNHAPPPFHNPQYTPHKHPPHPSPDHPQPPVHLPSRSSPPTSERALSDKPVENPWPSGEELYKELEKEAAAQGGELDVVSSRRKRAEYIRKQPLGSHSGSLNVTASEESLSPSVAQPKHSSPPPPVLEDTGVNRFEEPTAVFALPPMGPGNPSSSLGQESQIHSDADAWSVSTPNIQIPSHITPAFKVAPPNHPKERPAFADDTATIGRTTDKVSIQTTSLTAAPPKLSELNAISITGWKRCQPPAAPITTTPLVLNERDVTPETPFDPKGEATRQWVGSLPDPASSIPEANPSTPSAGSTALPVPVSPEPPARPDSTRPILPPQTVYVSEDEEDLAVSDGRSRDSQTIQTESSQKDPSAVSLHHANGVDYPVKPEIEAEARSSVNQRSSTGRSHRAYSERGNSLHYRRGSRTRNWWKSAPHPLYSPCFAPHRLYIKFPFPIRDEDIVPALRQHFSRYGSIRASFHLESNGKHSDKGVVVFDDPRSVNNCLQDPHRETFTFQSGPNPLAGSATFEVAITRSTTVPTTRTVFVRMTGPRSDARPRSASPVRRNDGPRRDWQKADTSFSHLPLPAKAVIYVRPTIDKGGRLRFIPKVLEPNLSWGVISRRVEQETGRCPQVIGEVDMTSRVRQEDIIPRLCDYFAEIIDIIPPNSPHSGWLVTVSGQSDSRRILGELQKLPGLTVRWAHAGDGLHIDTNERGRPQALSPNGWVEREMQTPIQRASCPSQYLPPFPPPPCPTIHDDGIQFQSPQQASTDVPSRRMSCQGDYAQEQAYLLPDHPAQKIPHPLLHREVMYMYKDGRPVVREQVNNSGVYIDKRAIHIGRLVKEKETNASLLDRFGRYGEVAHIEYNPIPVQSTYATARVLYHDREAAVRAREYENGRVSFGSAIKVSERIVQETDVRMQEVLVDPFGNVVPPPAAEQYSPPAAHIQDRADWVPPPPLPPYFGTRLSPMPPFPPHPQTPYMPPPVSFPTGGLMMMPMYVGHPMSSSHMVPPVSQPPLPPFPAQMGGVFPAPPASQISPDPVDGLLPAIQAMGIYCPPVWYPYPYPFRHPNPSPPPSPNEKPEPVGQPDFGSTMNPVPAPSQGGLLTPPPQLNDLAPVTGSDIPVSSVNQSRPRVIGIKFVDGEFKPEYHPDDLQSWYEAKNLEKAAQKAKGDRSPNGQERVSADGERVWGSSHQNLVPVPVPFSPSQTHSTTTATLSYPKIPRVPVPRET